ncbi:M48 family metalloprotease [Lentzea sp. NPDC059081]|uniref:M48 family metalloprotease n=1 Tax=Lentzea sp. NPDC059081 TaxID=3346719 RepID=UPI0036C65B8D
MATDPTRPPSGTTLRFAAFIALAVAVTLQTFGFYGSVWPAGQTLDDATCQVRSGIYFVASDAVTPDENRWSTYRECMSGLLLPRLGWVVGGLLLLFLVAATIYLAWPAWRIRRSGLVPVDDQLRKALEALVAETGLRAVPEFVLDPRSVRAGGVAFGNHRRKVVCVDAGLALLRVRDPAAFRAIVLHELAHVRSDVTTTYATLATWRAFLAVILAPYLLTLADPMLLSSTPWVIRWDYGNLQWAITVRLLVTAVLAYLARLAVLRSRENHADAQVVRWTGVTDPYGDLVPSRRVRRWLAIHPAKAARRAAMADPDSLARPGFWEVAAAALALHLAWRHTVGALSDLTWYHADNGSYTMLRVVWAALFGTLVLTIALRGATRPRRGVFAVPGLAIGVGVVLGDLLDPRYQGMLNPLTTVGWLRLTAAAVLVCCWAGYCAQRVRTGWHRALLAAAVALLCYSTMAWHPVDMSVSGLWQEFLRPAIGVLHGYSSSALDRVVLDGMVVPFLLNPGYPVTTIALLLVWLVPVVLTRALPSPAVWIGAASGLVALVVLVVMGTADSPEAALVRTAWGLVVTLAVQLVAAAVAARRTNWVGALLAAWLVGLFAMVGIWFAHHHGAAVDSVPAARPVQLVPGLALVAALLAAAVVKPGHRTWEAGPRAGALLAVIATVSVAFVWWGPSAAASAPLIAPPSARSGEDRDRMVTTWVYGGGWTTVRSVVVAAGTMFKTAQEQHRDVTAEDCGRLLTVVRAAGGFPPLPDEGLRATWTNVLADEENAALECMSPTGDGSRAAEYFQRAADGVQSLMASLDEARQRTVGS